MIKGLHHAALSVMNLDRSLEFYTGTLGLEVVLRSDFGGEVMDSITDLEQTRGRAALLRLGGQHLELFEFASPTPKESEPRRPVCDHGITHFCIEVTNVQQEYERLKAAGVDFHCPPQPFGVMRSTYARDPDGNVFELLEVPES